MPSFVLTELEKRDLTCACASCESAMWQIYENTTDRSVGFIDSNSFMFGEKRVRLACWCTVLHKFVQSQIPLCDGNSPEEEGEGDNAGENAGASEEIHGEDAKAGNEESIEADESSEANEMTEDDPKDVAQDEQSYADERDLL